MELIQPNINTSPIDSHSHIETPTKKIKKQTNADFNTADSIGLTDQKSSLNDIDPQQLFERFHDIIKISEVEEEDEDENPPTVYRKLDYEHTVKKAIKLDFSFENSSMSKRNKIQNGKCHLNPIKGKQLFEMMPVMSPIKRKIVPQNEVQSAETEQRVNQTPEKLTKTNSFCEMAARKESPYRDLPQKN